MNTIVGILGLLGFGWLATEIFGSWNQPVLGFIAIGLFAWCIAMTWLGIQQDKDIFGGKWWPF